jgi:hypothetical protein
LRRPVDILLGKPDHLSTVVNPQEHVTPIGVGKGNNGSRHIVRM